jgi:hypothetical protein
MPLGRRPVRNIALIGGIVLAEAAKVFAGFTQLPTLFQMIAFLIVVLLVLALSVRDLMDQKKLFPVHRQSGLDDARGALDSTAYCQPA